ncbi:hypothetical protein [Providencia hangzhouensis]|uniref:hypothetical protein n=1 Tax=Providencia hangzhouensis TaxID=3031799 RepID=UPI0034DD59A7
MFSKDPKKTTIDPVSIVKDEAVNQVKNKVQSKVNELVSSKVQKTAALAQQGGLWYQQRHLWQLRRHPN